MCAAFLQPKVPHFDGRAAVRRPVKRRNPRIQGLLHLITVPFAVKMWYVRRIAGHLAKIAAHSANSAAIPYPSASHTNHKSEVCDFLSKSGRQSFLIVAFFLTRTIAAPIAAEYPVKCTPEKGRVP